MTNQEAAEALRKVSLGGIEITITQRKAEEIGAGDYKFTATPAVEVRLQCGEHFTLTELRPDTWPAEHAEGLLEMCEDVFAQAVRDHVRRQIRAARGAK